MNASSPFPAELMIAARIRMERALYDRAKAVADDLGLTYAEYSIKRLALAVGIDEAAAVTRDAEARAA